MFKYPCYNMLVPDSIRFRLCFTVQSPTMKSHNRQKCKYLNISLLNAN